MLHLVSGMNFLSNFSNLLMMNPCHCHLILLTPIHHHHHNHHHHQSTTTTFTMHQWSLLSSTPDLNLPFPQILSIVVSLVFSDLFHGFQDPFLNLIPK